MPTTMTPQVRFRTVDGVRIRYADSGGSQEPAVVLTSPWPESVYAFAPMWASLSGHARLFAVDLPGFGASERREDLLSPRAMGTFLAQLIAEADLGTAHLVAPDVGTSAALFAAAAHPERIASAIVGSGGTAVPIQLGEPLASWVLDPDLDKYRRMDPRMIVGATLDTIAGGISDDIRADYLACTPPSSSTRSPATGHDGARARSPRRRRANDGTLLTGPAFKGPLKCSRAAASARHFA